MSDSTSVSPSPIVVALDYPDQAAALRMAQQLDPKQCRVKVGKELFTSAGPAVVEQLQLLGFQVFLDLKFHDIPNTTSKAVAAAASMGVWMVNVHASGGRRMMEACREVLQQHRHQPLLIAVTVLTSMSEDDMLELGYNGPIVDRVLALATLAQSSGMDGVVCSAQEVELLTQKLGREFTLVTPGIRPADSAGDDQRRTMTPHEALQAGSDYLVIGRPITQASDPAYAVSQILSEITARSAQHRA